MLMTWRSLKLRVRALLSRGRVERELEEEIAFHLERDTHKHLADGLSPDAARALARVRFGSGVVTAEACRDERGTRWVENIVRDVMYAVRMFRRTPMAALAIVVTLALGLSLVTVVYTCLDALIFRVDAVRNPRELFAVERLRAKGGDGEGDRGTFTRLQYEALVRETSVFADAYAILPDVDTRVEGRTLTGALVSGNFFRVLGVSAALGRTLTVADEPRGGVGGNPVIVLSRDGWARNFASDPGVIGRTVQLNGTTFEIVGVMPEGFRGLSVSAPDYWAPLSLVGRIRRGDAGHEDAVGIGIIGRLRPGLPREQALAELVVWDARQIDRAAGDRPLASLTLEPRLGTAPVDEAMWLLAPLFFSFSLILLIGCANVANLLLARAVARQREIGIRLATGASRRRIVGQLLTESLLLAFVSAAVAFVLSRLALDAIGFAVMHTIPPDLGDIRFDIPPAGWRIAVFLVAGAFATTLAFALAPALQSTRVELVRAMRGEVVRDARPSRTRNVLIALQVTASVLLLICAAVFLRSALTAATFDPGIRTSDTVTFDIANEQTRRMTLDAVTREPTVASTAASFPSALGWRNAFARAGAAESSTSPLAYKFVSPEYFDVLGIAIVRGRAFTQSERSATSAVAVISESAARQLWPDGEAVGQILQLEPDADPSAANAGDSANSRDAGAAKAGDSPNSSGARAANAASAANAAHKQNTDREPTLLSRSVVVVGVARDVRGFRFFRFKEPMVYVPIGADAARTSLTMRVHGDPELARRALVDRLAIIDANIRQVITLRTFAGMEMYFLRAGFWLTLALGVLALLLTLSGLFSVLSYLVEQRGKEIGVRMALGATRRQIGLLVLKQLARPVSAGLLAGATLAAALGAALLATPIAAQISASVRLFDPIAYTASLTCIITACACAALIPALRAGRIDPVATLRRD
jgi:predicted permease